MTNDAHHRPLRLGLRLAWLVIGVLLAGVASAAYLWLSLPIHERRDSSGLPADPPRRDLAAYEEGPPWFQDMTASSGVHFTYRNGEEADLYTILESLGGGVALLDYDGDGLLDIFLPAGGRFETKGTQRIVGLPCKLYRNLGDWKFEDVTRAAGLELGWWYTHGAAVADFDRDGWPDLLVTGYGRLGLFHNEADGKGGRRFVDVSERLLGHCDSWNTGAGWADLDGDGFPDLYVCRYTDWSLTNNPACIGQLPGVTQDVCPPHRFNPLRHILFRNDQGRRFTDVSAEHGFKAEGYGLGVILADFNDDARPDVYVTNDMTRNFLFINRSGKLEEKALAAGAALDESGRATASMGVDASDYDGTGRPSLLVTNFQRELPSLFGNLGSERFYYRSTAAGLGALSRNYVGWGASFVDLDNDGWEDLVIANGHLFRYPAGSLVKQPRLLLQNVELQGRRGFRDAGVRAGGTFSAPAVGRGLAVGDLDNDGWPDLVVSNSNSPVVVLRNQARALHNHHWLGVRLVGKGNRDVVGSTVIADTPTRTLTRFVKGGGSYLSASDQRLLFGLAAENTLKRLTVKWSWGESQSWADVASDSYYELREGEPEAKRIEPRRKSS